MTEPDAGGPSAGWLVVIDMQRVFADPASPWATPGFEAVLANVRQLADAFDERVVLTRFVAPPSPAGAWRQYYEQWPFALVAETDPLYDVVDGLDVERRAVVTRPRFGKWDDEQGSLRELTSGAPSLVLAGVSTDCCVLSTALSAADDGIQVRVVVDACAGVTEADHQRALSAMNLYAPLITLTSTAGVLRLR